MKLFKRKPNVERLKATKNVAGLLHALEHETCGVQRDVVDALGEIKEKTAVEPLTELLEATLTSSSQAAMWLQEDIIRALGKIGGNRAFEVLVNLLSRALGTNIDFTAERALVELGNADVRPLIQCLNDKDANTRQVAASLLRQVRDERALPPFIQALKHENSEVRREAASALGEIGSKVAIDPLIRALDDENSEVRREAASALGEIGSKVTIDPLIRALDDENSEVRWAAACSLWGTKDMRARETVRRAKPPIEEESRRETFSKRFQEMMGFLSEMAIVGESECILALKSDGSSMLPAKARKLSRWATGGKDDIVDVLATCGGHYRYSRIKWGRETHLPYMGGSATLVCKSVKATQRAIWSSIQVGIIYVASEAVEHWVDGDKWDALVRGELYVLRSSKKEYRFFFKGSEVSGYGVGGFTIP
jgi:HEAT repeat protein